MNETAEINSPITPRRTYLLVYVALMVLLLATIGTDFLPLGPFNTLINLTIAAVKALLVVLFFMHVRHSSPLTKLFVFAGLLWLMLLIGLTLNDYLTRWNGLPFVPPTLFR